ncbi:VanW family protein [Metabacillus fastidiosus]|uniref:VanW family protein n=1 Tax=Metabacillus fastidiosus TaxID=1458 RepID=UPI002DBEF881|nr:VanW family protein [Metabacillus fastidiosus]MEC2076794.1 VanW family protein [Metabacillus fastidiosus]
MNRRKVVNGFLTIIFSSICIIMFLKFETEEDQTNTVEAQTSEEKIKKEQPTNIIIKQSAITLTNDYTLSFFDKEIKVPLKHNETFSLQTFFEQQQILNENEESLNRIATGIYGLIVESPFEMIERHISSVQPEYAELGLEAAFKRDKWDLKFYNPQDHSYELSFKNNGGQLILQLIGPKLSRTYEVVKQDERTYKPQTIIQFDPALKPDAKVINNGGRDGEAVTVIKREYEDGWLENETVISTDFYPPVFKVEKRGLKSAAVNNENSTVTENDTSEVEKKTEAEQKVDKKNLSQDSKQENKNDDDLWEKPEIMK